MKIPYLTAYLAKRRLNKRMAALCRQSLHNAAKKRSDAAVRANQTRQHYDSSTDRLCKAVRRG